MAQYIKQTNATGVPYRFSGQTCPVWYAFTVRKYFPSFVYFPLFSALRPFFALMQQKNQAQRTCACFFRTIQHCHQLLHESMKVVLYACIEKQTWVTQTNFLPKNTYISNQKDNSQVCSKVLIEYLF